MATVIFLITLLFLVSLVIVIRGYYLIHKLQQLGYGNLKLINWLQSDRYRTILLWDIFELFAPMLLIYILYYSINQVPLYKYLTSSIMIVVFIWKIVNPFLSGWIGKKANVKKPLIFTQRVIRLSISFMILTVLTMIFSFYFTATPLDHFTLSTRGFLKFNSFILFVAVISPLLVIIANVINYPIEERFRRVYFNKASKKIRRSKLKVVGITGSFGKTSSKFFLTTILKEHYKTFCTPESYNTPMGISKVINSTVLDDYDYFICEMGADHKGDIDVLCKLARPDHSIITAIGEQHLETFHTVENIIKTKLSLFKNTDEVGYKIYNYDSDLLKNSVDSIAISSTLYAYSIFEDNKDRVQIYAKNIRHTREGLEFSVVFRDGREFEIKTSLLGRHNVSNLLGAILLSDLLGVPTNIIQNGIKKITPVPHRLQKIDPGTGVLVLDDAFNSNPEGAFEALRILREIDGNKRIIVTPGFIELGEKEDEYNYQLGQMIAEYTDIAILVGSKRTIPIRDGVLASGKFKEDKLFIVNSIPEAQEHLKTFVTAGDIILFENDLPDTFSE